MNVAVKFVNRQMAIVLSKNVERACTLCQCLTFLFSGCKDEHPDCEMVGELHCKEEEDERIKGFMEKHCRRTCNVDNCK